MYIVGDFHCPITQERMRDPVVAAGELELLFTNTSHSHTHTHTCMHAHTHTLTHSHTRACTHTHIHTHVHIHTSAEDGFTYERSAITNWFGQGRRTSPSTNLPLPNTLLVPNKHLRTLIEKTKNSAT